MSERVAVLTALLFAVSSLTSGVLGGGLLICLLVDWRIENGSASSEILILSAATFFVFVLAVATGSALFRCRYRRARWGAVATLLGIVMAVEAGELLLRSQLPDWPARALHGVRPEQWAAAVQFDSNSAGNKQILNSWGERDRERTRHPQSGTRRIAFIGDSFLEEGSWPPVSLATETKIARQDVEVINLGVSATGPDEYFDRLRGVAWPLGVSHCCLFIFAGNDFVSPARTLPSYCGIASVDPRPSLLTSVWLDGWNHALTNKQRPVMQAWMQGATLAADERNRSLALKLASDADIRAMLLGAAGFESDAHEHLAMKLNREGIETFFEILRNPDADRFRSYYLGDALRAAADDNWQWEPNSEVVAWQWTEQAARFCRRRGIDFTVVVIPEAFQIDDRMREQWLPLADMRKCTAPCREAASRFVERARTASIDVVDLHDVLRGTRGTYLNLDGHWSDLGVEKVSGLLAKHLGANRSAPGVVTHEPR